MLLKKFRIVLFLIPFNLHAFSDMNCIGENFNARVAHKVAPFGLLEKILDISKSNCVVTIKHIQYQFFKKTWVIDVCRTPVHIKEGSGSVDVLKQSSNGCPDKKNEKYCNEMNTIQSVFQDDGLIFAEGEKENLNSVHGKIYCAYLLFNNYLKIGMVINRNKDYQDVLEPNLKPLNVIAQKEEPGKPIEAQPQPEVDLISNPNDNPSIPTIERPSNEYEESLKTSDDKKSGGF